MTTIAGRNCKIEIALTLDSAISPTAVTKATSGVATLTGHGVDTGDVGFWTVAAGMVELDGQAVYCTDTDANTFTLNGLDTTLYSTFTAGTLTLAATWGLLDEAGGYSVGGGAAAQLDDSRLHLSKVRNIAGLNASEDLTVNIKTPEIEGAALTFLTRAARNGTSVLLKISKGTQILRVAYGVPSTYGEQVDVGGLGTGSFNIICPAYVLKPNV
jgi:hypothetical protein